MRSSTACPGGDADIMLAEDEQQLGVGTTVTGAALTLHGAQPFWTIFNIGDSRVYVFEHNELAQVTVDHSVVQELVDAGHDQCEADAETHPDNNIITRAVGFNADPMPDYWLLPVRAGTAAAALFGRPQQGGGRTSASGCTWPRGSVRARPRGP